VLAAVNSVHRNFHDIPPLRARLPATPYPLAFSVSFFRPVWLFLVSSDR
jgi:hypothetical protein